MKNRLQDILDNDENILWQGSPALVPFLATGFPFLVLGLLWGMIDYSFIRVLFSSPNNPGIIYFALPFFLLHLSPFWLSILNIFRLILVFNNTIYAITNKRVILRSGFWGIDFKSVDYDKISDLSVTVNPLENIYNVGTIRINSGVTNSKGAIVYDSVTAVADPYGVYKKIKTTSVNIKTDWNYPNKLRPDENTGYQTQYRPQ